MAINPSCSFDQLQTEQETLSDEVVQEGGSVVPGDNPDGAELDTAANTIPLAEFLNVFGTGLLQAVQAQNAPIYNNVPDPDRHATLAGLARAPFLEQQHVVQACAKLLVDEGCRAAIINGEMGSGKTMMGIALATVLHGQGYPRTLVVCPPHLVYKWRREIKQTVPGAVVWILNGPDTLRKLLLLRAMHERPPAPTFFIMGRVRMRMGFNWKPSFATRHISFRDDDLGLVHQRVASCAGCGTAIEGADPDGAPKMLSPAEALEALNSKQQTCSKCGDALWTLYRSNGPSKSPDEVVAEALKQIPTIGDKTADKLIKMFGSNRLSGMLEDNMHEFINLMDGDGELVFSDRQARRMERAMANTEFSFGVGGYQPSEFVKRYLPKGYFGLLIADEGHEFKNEGSAQGQAFGVLSSQCRKAVALTGTLMGGYADDLFYLLWRLNPSMMIDDGFTARGGSLSSASLAYMREHGVIKDIYRETGASGEERAHRTAKGKAKISHRVAKAPGFGPVGIIRHILPMTAFLRLRDIGANALPPYRETVRLVTMTEVQREAYMRMAARLKDALATALRCGDRTLMGVVLNVLLAWPDCGFRAELVHHPRTRALLAAAPVIFTEVVASPKELELIDICKAAKARKRRVLVYSAYTGVRDTTARLKQLLEQQGFKAAVLRASVDPARREDWIQEKVDQGFDVVICNPDLVKTGLDLIDFTTIVFMQTGLNTYTFLQAAKRSWRIGQKEEVEVYVLCFEGTAQVPCVQLMAKKVAVSQSTSGVMPETGLDVLNESDDSIEVELAKQLLAA